MCESNLNVRFNGHIKKVTPTAILLMQGAVTFLVEVVNLVPGVDTYFATLLDTSGKWLDAFTLLLDTSKEWLDAFTLLLDASGEWLDAFTLLLGTSGEWLDALTLLLDTQRIITVPFIDIKK